MAADQKREHKPKRESSKHQFYFNILAHQTEDSPSFHCQFCGRCYCRNLGNLDILSSRYILSLRSLYHQIYSPFKMSYVLFFLPSVVTRTYFRSKHGCSWTPASLKGLRELFLRLWKRKGTFANIRLSCFLNKIHPPSFGRLYRGINLMTPLFIHWWGILGLVPPLLLEAPKRAVKLCVVVFFSYELSLSYAISAANDFWGKRYLGWSGESKMTQSLSIITGCSAGATACPATVNCRTRFWFRKIGKFCRRTIRACQNQVCSFGLNSFGNSFIW